MSTSFEHLRAYDPTGRTARFYLPLAPVSRLNEDGEPQDFRPYLELKYAGDTNKPYQRDLAKMTLKAVRGTQPDADQAIAQIEQDREQDLALFADHVVCGWGYIVDTEGDVVSFTHDDCTKFLRSLPSWIFDRVRVFAKSAQNFSNDPSDEQARQTAGN